MNLREAAEYYRQLARYNKWPIRFDGDSFCYVCACGGAGLTSYSTIKHGPNCRFAEAERVLKETTDG